MQPVSEIEISDSKPMPSSLLVFFFSKSSALIIGTEQYSFSFEVLTSVSSFLISAAASLQHRIVAKIEELIPYIDKYEQAETQLTELNNNFPELLKATPHNATKTNRI